ncbi:ferri-bacillibactin esterase [Echria macrotheca]|uniref:Ferri-bacillibactin esterase n=1 Tax=Echria macrotheca TaxID=438768 RepID=A0AAJ0B3J4_9PEZI|nr:ferri-bacillibactin esterase [Echria macrotheca]
MAATIANWTFTPYPPFPPTVFPNIALWNATNPIQNSTFQIQVSWPFEWSSSREDITNKTALTMYILDGNAHGTTASEAVKRRQPVSFGQPDTVVVSIGYPLTNAVYDMTHRFVDYKPPWNTSESGPGKGDDFLDFIASALRPFIHTSVFPGNDIRFTRDAIYGHSFGGLLAAYALVTRPDMFDTFLIASPALETGGGRIHEEIRARWGTGDLGASAYCVSSACGFGCSAATNGTKEKKPAVMITYGSLETFPGRRRTETEGAFQTRRAYFRGLGLLMHCHDFFDEVKASGRVRDVVLKEYVGQDHAGVAASAITDGIDYFVDW